MKRTNQSYLVGSDVGRRVHERCGENLENGGRRAGIDHEVGFDAGVRESGAVVAGNVARRPNGKWRARYRDESGRERARHFDRKGDARRWLNHITASVMSGTYVDPAVGRITLAAYFREWSERQLWAPTTNSAMSLTVRSLPFGSTPIGLVRRSDVETWIKAMDDAGLAPGTIKTRYSNLRAVFRAAIRDGIVHHDPSDNVRLPRRQRPDVVMVLPTPQEVSRLLSSASPEPRTLFALCAFGGLRLGEAAAVQVGDVDFGRRSLRISRQVQRGTSGTVDIRPPKWGSERVVYLADGLIDLLRSHIADRGSAGEEHWLFGEEGTPPHQGTVGYWWRKTLLAAGLSDIRLHDLRHFYASGLIYAGCDVVAVRNSLGHVKTSTTLDTYAHLWSNAEGRTRAAAQSIVNSSIGDWVSEVHMTPNGATSSAK